MNAKAEHRVVDDAAARRPTGVRAALLDAARRELHDHGATGVSLRAVARRAGVSHAAPKHHFDDRAGLLTALAVDGHRRLTLRLRHAGATVDPAGRLAALARAYLDFGFDEPALFELMFRADQLHPDDAELVAAGRGSFGVLLSAVDTGRPDRDDRSTQDLAMVAWAFVHGLVVLVRDGALQGAAGSPSVEPPVLASSLVDVFTTILRASTG